MKKIAIDVVLLPPKKLAEWCVKVSHEFLHLDKHPFPLNLKDNLPHISLYMGVLYKKNLPAARRALRQVARQFKPLMLTISNLEGRRPGTDSAMFFLKIKIIKQIYKLHTTVIKLFEPLTSRPANAGMYFKKSHEWFDKTTMEWLNKFLTVASFKKFDPHITLRTGFAKVGKNKFPIRFIAKSLAICHLGTKSTCRKIVYKTSLV